MGNSCITSTYNKNGFFPGGGVPDSSFYRFWKSDRCSTAVSELNHKGSSGNNDDDGDGADYDDVEKDESEGARAGAKNKHKNKSKDGAVITPVSPRKPPDTISIAKTSQSNNADAVAATATKPPLLTPRNIQEDHAAKHGNGPCTPRPVKSLTASVLGRQTENLKDLYVLGRKLGQGQFGTTFFCTEKSTGKEFACKSIAKRKLICQEDVDDVVREIRIMHHLSGHPNIVTIKGAYEDLFSVHLVMELCAGGELFNRIVQKGHYSERKAAELTRTIVGVVQACHSLGVMHRDLKPENFLFYDKEEDSPLKTIDFGLSVFFKPGETFQDVVGSPYYVAPEVLLKSYGPAADVWSAGVILYILLSGVPPFWAETEQEIFNQVLNGELDFVSDPWPSISESAKDLIRKMVVRNPEKRYTAHQVLCHPWIREDGVAPDKPIDSAVLTRMKQFMAMNKMKKIALRVIAERLSEEEIAGLKEVFKMIDADNSGSITFDELKTGLKKLGSTLSDTEIQTLMEAADVDGNGTIDHGEFIAATLNRNKIEREENLLAAFSYFDKDQSGYITVDELQQACNEFNMDHVHIEEMIRDADQDNDGRIDYTEFVAMMRKGNGGFGRAALRNSLATAGGGLRDALRIRLPS